MFKLFIKKWLFLFVLIASSLIIGIRLSLPFFCFLFWFLVSLVAASLLWTAIALLGTKLVLSRKALNKADEDDLLKVEALVKNNGFLPVFNLVLEDNLSCAEQQNKKKLLLIECLNGKSYLTLKYDCICPLRGKYSIGPFVAYFFDPLGLFYLKKVYYIYSELYVYPNVFRIKKFRELNKGILPWFGIETSRISGDDDEFFGTREYKDGDPIKRIHWISTARKRKLIVTQFQKQSFFRATVMFNLEKDKNFGEGKERVAEYIIKIAASVASYFVERGISLEVIAHSDEMIHIPFNKGAEHLEDVLNFLAVAVSESRVSLGDIYEEFSLHIQDDSTLIVIMPDTDLQFLSLMLELKEKNVSLVPLIIKTATFLNPFEKHDIREEAKALPSYLFNLNPTFFSRGDNLEEVFS